MEAGERRRVREMVDRLGLDAELGRDAGEGMWERRGAGGLLRVSCWAEGQAQPWLEGKRKKGLGMWYWATNWVAKIGPHGPLLIFFFFFSLGLGL